MADEQGAQDRVLTTIEWKLQHADDRTEIWTAALAPVGTFFRFVEIVKGAKPKGKGKAPRRPVGVSVVFIPGLFAARPGEELPQSSRIVVPGPGFGGPPPGGPDLA